MQVPVKVSCKGFALICCLLVLQVDDMQEMAGKYADTVEENRRLYNEVQDLKGNIRVFCRIRPPGTTGDQNPSCLTAGVEGEVRNAREHPEPRPSNINPTLAFGGCSRRSASV